MNTQKPVRPTQEREEALLAKGKKRILQSGDWLPAHDLENIAHLNTADLRYEPNQWKQAGEIFTLQHEGIDYFPIYGLDPAKGYRPRSGLAPVITVLAFKKDGWGMAFWFGSSNSYLGGRMPKDVLMKDPRIVLEAAKDEISGIHF